LAGDLDNIVLKAVRKEPQRRYASVEQFSEDIRRHLEKLPVTARKDSWSYRAGKFVRRHKMGMAAAALVVLAVLGGVAATIREAHIAQAERQRAEKRFNDVRKLANSFLFEFHDAIQNLPGSTPARELVVKRALEYLDGLAKEAGDDAFCAVNWPLPTKKLVMSKARHIAPILGTSRGHCRVTERRWNFGNS
jgi:non-specific serine/threonine protein kinase/serine/threonine-protein kinase